MSAHASGGSPAIFPQQYRTLPIAVISQAEQQDRGLRQSELQELTNFFRSGAKRLEVAAVLSEHANEIVAAAANRIFYGGSPMAYLEAPPNRENLPGSNTPLRPRSAPPKEKLQVETASYGNPFRGALEFMQTQLRGDRDPLPDGFRLIHVKRYGPRRMKNSMRDLAWFLRYVTYAIVAGDASILTVNVRGLRGVIPEDVTEATVVAMREMRWRSLNYFKQDAEACDLIREYFDGMITDYLAEKPSNRVRQGISNDQQGLELPENYALSVIPRHRFVMKPNLSETEKQEVIKAAYRQVFERDITREYGVSLTDLESRFRSGEISTKEFVRRMGKSRLYRNEFYEPFVVSRFIELAVRHFLGRGVSSPEEFQQYFDVVSSRGWHALIDTLVDSQEYADYFGEETVPYLRGYGLEAQECRNWGPQLHLFKFCAPAHKIPQFITQFGDYQKPLPNQHPYGAGNDPLEIRFGAIFPQPSWKGNDHPASFNKDHRRILISCEAGNGHGTSHALNWGQVPGTSNRLLKLNQMAQPNGKHGKASPQGVSVNLAKNSPTAIIEGTYRQLFGREVYPEQRLTAAELKLKSAEITVREFVRQLAKSRSFRHMYWESLYITKAIEYIHRRLLGRPTYGRQEMGRYYDICAKKGFYALIDELVDSPEYIATFGEDTVPYERFVTPRGYELRSRSSTGTLRLQHERLGSSVPGPRVAENFSGWIKAALGGGDAAHKRAQLQAALLEQKPLSYEVLDAAKQLQLESEPAEANETPNSQKAETSPVQQPTTQPAFSEPGGQS
ncbi:phycobilisome rod-core linker polypeptide [Leptothermofonsia sp. ETS-13]|uniref:phycobilisome rod-core linker polypeptide n=1 Tax=Leptothermofonsia sp. ETS-13 TaxID=3035696 RepID=UPI003BA08C29